MNHDLKALAVVVLFVSFVSAVSFTCGFNEGRKQEAVDHAQYVANITGVEITAPNDR